MIAMEQKLASLPFLDIYTGCFVKMKTFFVGFKIHYSYHINTINQLNMIFLAIRGHRIATKQTA